MNKVIINETELPIKEHEGQRVVTFKEIDAVHGRPDGTARKRFNENKIRFIEGVDYFVRNPDEAANEFGVTAPNGLKLLTESGYLMLVKSFTDDLAWEVQRQLVNSYFKVGQQPVKALADPTAEKRARAMALNAKTRAAKQLMTLWDKAGVSPAYQALALGDYYAEDGIKLPAIALQSTKVTYDKTTIADKLGILSKSGKPHAQAVGAIIAQLNIGESEREAVPYSRNGHDGVDYQYTESVIDKVDGWLTQHGQPAQIISGGKSYSVKYV